MLYVLIALVIVGADQWFKGYIALVIAPGGEKEFIPGLVKLTNVRNYGAAFSMLEDMRLLILIVTLVFCAAAVVFLLLGQPKDLACRISVAMLLGGAAGNAIDRLLDGYVVDMFEFEFVRFAIFNIADCFITVGGILLCLYVLMTNNKKQLKGAKSSTEPGI